MPTYEIEMLWSCATCKNAVNKGLSKHCTNCGKPKSNKDIDIMPDDVSENNALSGTKQKQALAGPDWNCNYCNTLQNSLGPCCGECGANQAIEQFHKEQKQLEVSALDYIPSYKNNHLISVAAIGGLIALTALLYFVFRTKVVDVTVSSVHWEHKVHIDRYQVYQKEGFSADYNAFDIQMAGNRIHHYDHVLVGSHRQAYQESYVCGQTCNTPSCYTTSRSCTSNKNGTATCSGGDRVCPSPVCSAKYCDRTAYKTIEDYQDIAIYRTWYNWKIWDWGYNRTVVHKGDNFDTNWPTEEELTTWLSSGEKERNRQEASYTITFSDSKDHWSINTATLEEFKMYPISSKHRIKVGFTGIQVIQ